jgi:hypothetical protein
MPNPPGRAPRFPLHLALRYRPVGETDWREGCTENISRSGVLFLAEGLMAVDTRIEMRFALPVGHVPSGVACRGRVVRTVSPLANGGRPALAATISGYRFVRHAAAA